MDCARETRETRQGHKKRKGQWRIPGRGGPLSYARAKKVRSDWAKAWEDQRIDDYLSFYSRTFEPPGQASREGWEAERKQRISRPSRIEVRVALLELRVTGVDRSEIEFLQSYESDRFSDVVVKTLELVREGGSWKIAAERLERGKTDS